MLIIFSRRPNDADVGMQLDEFVFPSAFFVGVVNESQLTVSFIDLIVTSLWSSPKNL